MPKVKSFTFTDTSFISNDVEYFIDTDSMCYERLKRFNALIPSLAYGIGWDVINERIADCIKFARGQKSSVPKNEINNHTIMYDVTNELINLYDAMSKVTLDDVGEDLIELHLDFCCLFINTETEDTTQWNKAVMDRKKANWKKDMDMYSFFLFAKMQIPKYKGLLKELLEAMKEGKVKVAN